MVNDSTTYIPNNYTSCVHRLPCGLCTLTNKPCPMDRTKIEPTWENTCDFNAVTVANKLKQFGFQGGD